MNAPTALSHLAPEVHQRAIPAEFLVELQARFGVQCSTALVVREQHGRDESVYEVPPPVAVVFAESTKDVADAVTLAAKHRVPVIPFGVGSSLEGSNTDIADEFTKLIVTQQAYSANTRVISTSNQMVQDLLNTLR